MVVCAFAPLGKVPCICNLGGPISDVTNNMDIDIGQACLLPLPFYYHCTYQSQRSQVIQRQTVINMIYSFPRHHKARYRQWLLKCYSLLGDGWYGRRHVLVSVPGTYSDALTAGIIVSSCLLICT